MKHDNCRTCIPAMFCIHPAYSNSCSKPKPSLHVHVKVLLLDFTFSLKHPTAAPHLACGWRAAAVRPIIKICIFHIYFRFLIKIYFFTCAFLFSCHRAEFAALSTIFAHPQRILPTFAASSPASAEFMAIFTVCRNWTIFENIKREMCRPSANRYEVVWHLPQLALHHKLIYEGLELHCPWAAQLMQHLFSL